MTDILVKIFVKDWENVEDHKVRERYGVLAGIVGIVSNAVLFIIKLLVGLAVNSISVMADGFNNLSDAISSVISLLGAKMSSKPADKEHPFGHGRVEYVVTLVVAFLVLQVGFSLFKSSVGKIRSSEELNFSFISMGILLVSAAVKLWQSMFNRKLGKRIQSKVLKATSADSLSDVIATFATIISLAVYGIWGYNIDGISGILVSLFVLWSGIDIIKDTIGPLIGEPIDKKVFAEITGFVESFDGVIGTHDLIVHNYGQGRNMASIHVEISDKLELVEAHELVDGIEREALRQRNLLLVVHMDPIETENETVLYFKGVLEEVLNKIDNRITYHDFRMVDGQESVSLIFEVVVPYEYEKEQQEALESGIRKGMEEREPRCRCIMTIEKSYCAEH